MVRRERTAQKRAGRELESDDDIPKRFQLYRGRHSRQRDIVERIITNREPARYPANELMTNEQKTLKLYRVEVTYTNRGEMYIFAPDEHYAREFALQTLEAGAGELSYDGQPEPAFDYVAEQAREVTEPQDIRAHTDIAQENLQAFDDLRDNDN